MEWGGLRTRHQVHAWLFSGLQVAGQADAEQSLRLLPCFGGSELASTRVCAGVEIALRCEKRPGTAGFSCWSQRQASSGAALHG